MQRKCMYFISIWKKGSTMTVRLHFMNRFHRTDGRVFRFIQSSVSIRFPSHEGERWPLGLRGIDAAGCVPQDTRSFIFPPQILKDLRGVGGFRITSEEGKWKKCASN
ncbi:uncharacterized protein [Linepithema humile]|uniref:uncharacterized protein n=1 Tax=Linepithema humile TaxID=83485 RepID=UPI00351F4BE2